MIVDCIDSVTYFFKRYLDLKIRVFSCEQKNDTWKVEGEVLVDPEYTRRKGLGDLVEVYEVTLDDNLDVTSYKLIGTKKRGSVDLD